MPLMYNIKKYIKSEKDLVYYTNHPPTQTALGGILTFDLWPKMKIEKKLL